jgi:hypothetical protein
MGGAQWHPAGALLRFENRTAKETRGSIKADEVFFLPVVETTAICLPSLNFCIFS